MKEEDNVYIVTATEIDIGYTWGRVQTKILFGQKGVNLFV